MNLQAGSRGPRDADRAAAVGYANTAVDEPHDHRATTEIYLFARGAATMLVDGRPLRVPEGGVVVLAPGEVHPFAPGSAHHYPFVVQTPGLAGQAARQDKVRVPRATGDGGPCAQPAPRLRAVARADRPWVEQLLREHWGSTASASRGRLHQAVDLPGAVAEADGARLGLATYAIGGDGCARRPGSASPPSTATPWPPRDA